MACAFRKRHRPRGHLPPRSATHAVAYVTERYFSQGRHVVVTSVVPPVAASVASGVTAVVRQRYCCT
ncbi:hypothetical protein EAO75_00615 [Streptomyces sp. uw30]|nr:hypothetical protein EAO75_00615 [Streptomyces sp. uw30]